MKPKLVVLITHPIQYYAPLYRELATRNEIDLHVIFLSDSGATAYYDQGFGVSLSWDIPLLEGYQYTVLEPGLALGKLGFWRRYSSNLRKALNQLNPDFILLYGYGSRMNWVALRWAFKKRCGILYTSDSNALNQRNVFKKLLKKILVSKFFKTVNCFFSTSESNVEYLMQFGVKRNDIYRVPFAIDYSRWSNHFSGCNRRRKYDFAWAGKFVSLKRPMDFINALKVLSEKINHDVYAIMIGDGPLRGEIETLISELPPSCHIELSGFVNQGDMPATLQQSDTFIFSSEKEAYGLIATEAAAAGLALIVAERIGCIGETVLARPNVNALIYPPGDVNALASAMQKLFSQPDTRGRMQIASKEIAKEHDISVAASIIEGVLLTEYRQSCSTNDDKLSLV